MLSYFFANLRNLIATNRSLLRRLGRCYRDVFRKNPEMRQHFVLSVKAAESGGDVEKVDKEIIDYDAEFNRMMVKYVKGEENLFIVEGDALRPLQRVETYYDLILRHKSIIRMLPKEIVPAIENELGKIGARLSELVITENKVLMGENIQIERQQKGERGQLQSLVLSPNELQVVFDDLWNERSEVPQEKRLSKKEASTEEAVLAWFKKIETIARTNPEETKQVRLREYGEKLLDAVKKLGEQTEALVRLYEKSLKEFADITAVLADMSLKLTQEERELVANELDKLKSEEFPQADLERILKALQLHKGKLDDEQNKLVNIETRNAVLRRKEAEDPQKLRTAA